MSQVCECSKTPIFWTAWGKPIQNLETCGIQENQKRYYYLQISDIFRDMHNNALTRKLLKDLLMFVFQDILADARKGKSTLS